MPMQAQMPKFPKWIVAFVPVLIALLFFKSFFTIIPTGSVGVQTLFGSVRENVVIHEGFNFINPLTSVNAVSVQVQKHTAKYDAASSDMQRVHVEMVLNYHVNPDQAWSVYQHVGPQYETVIVDPAAQEVLKAVTAKHVASEILHERAAIKGEVEKLLAEWLKKYGLELQEAALAEIKFDPTYEQAIEQKQIQEQKAEQKRYELIQAQRQAEIVAAAAKGEADALKIKGEAEAAYNDNVSKSLSPSLLQQAYLQKWDGHLPTMLMDGKGGNLLFQIDSSKTAPTLPAERK